MARNYPHATSAQLLYRPAEGPPFFEAWTPEDTANDDLLCAEMSRLAYAGRLAAATALTARGFELQSWIGGETPAERSSTGGTDGFIATGAGAGLTVLAFRGTEANKPEDVLADGLAMAVPWDPTDPSKGRIHEGFARAYGQVREGVHKVLAAHRGRVLITGHSLGAGLATLAASEHAGRNPALTTFGSPRVGDEAFKATLAGVTTIHRFVDCCDLVTRIPPERFDEPHIEKLLVDLIPERLRSGLIWKGLIRRLAAGLADGLAAVRVQPEYTHVGDTIYGNRAGQRIAATPTEIEADQGEARAAYHGSLTPDLPVLLTQLQGAVLAAGIAGNVAAVRTAVRSFASAIFQADPVPLRDLADHAPLNYVTLFTGRS
jgi:pimeloyl-ACP methyl ester carboxylesterase